MRTAVIPALRACAVSVVQVRVDRDLASVGEVGGVLDTAVGLCSGRRALGDVSTESWAAGWHSTREEPWRLPRWGMPNTDR